MLRLHHEAPSAAIMDAYVCDTTRPLRTLAPLPPASHTYIWCHTFMFLDLRSPLTATYPLKLHTYTTNARAAQTTTLTHSQPTGPTPIYPSLFIHKQAHSTHNKAIEAPLHPKDLTSHSRGRAHQLSLLMSVDVRQAFTSLRFPARVETVSRSQLSKVHTGDSTRPAET